MSLMGTLGLDSVEADPNFLPDGPYKGEVYKSEYFVTKSDVINHVITYRVVDGPRKGVQKQEWFALGTNPVYSDDPSHTLVNMTPTMSEAAKAWYKKRHVDLGIPEAEVSQKEPKDLIGIPVNFTIKTKDGYHNIGSVTKRDAPAAGAAMAAALGVNQQL